MYRLTSFGKTRRALPGVPWRELSNEEYDAAVAKHPGMEEQGYFAKVEEAPAEKPARGRRMTEDTAATPPAEEVSDDR